MAGRVGSDYPTASKKPDLAIVVGQRDAVQFPANDKAQPVAPPPLRKMRTAYTQDAAKLARAPSDGDDRRVPTARSEQWPEHSHS